MTANTTPGLQVMDHPLVAHKLTILRRKDTPSHVFRHTLHELSWLLAHPTFAALKTVEDNIETPLEMMTAATMRAPFPCLVSILRAGNGLIDGFSQVCPEASVGHLGLYRDHDTMTPVSYYTSLPSDIEKRQVILGDPMLATGGSAIMAVEKLREMGVTDMVFSCLVAVPEGVAALQSAHPDVPIITAALDRELNDKCYILPGLGDAGDRIYGTD
ncbi:MAG TPA: uracil phosphoribosyltransferase [Alphaproteobacteria bacterium]|jgi:uracil phosphoribosyltransferase|nr:MAG: uracil phosphoribosyltransferase [SAR116 cluster bacterium MED-G05]HCA91176.1 uracil phosphoribosyltransferase [Alphaproteobacteria bacterium]HCD79603.1 uracil phosphoribosyltransferase [Alphaproteobacteria bacterium]HCM09145.1 uracil phosphoribosyltransferase [Alphaproteobacteria bacterium]|tara:strand:- start:7747 stop:8391 length:645 start_codon:yes stop_codon:yes gene_type:complete